VFGLFKSASFQDPLLGELVRSRGYWRGTLALEGCPTALALAGTRAAPDAAAIAAARALTTQFTAWRPAIGTALFEHYAPYAEAVAAGEYQEDSDAFPRMASPLDVWPHARLEYVSIAPLDGVLTTELGYLTAWDEEHTLGVRFAGDRFVALCGSVLRP
jgi:hypothetical protein